MKSSDPEGSRPKFAAGVFTTTHWSVVLSAGHPESPSAQQALDLLCRNYWYPLYAFVRREGHSPMDAEDLTQGFFAKLVEKNYLGQVHRERGKFRSFLLAALRHYVCDEYDRDRALKRGGGRVVRWDEADRSEERYRNEKDETLSPERLYDREWAVTLLERALERLRREYRAAEKEALFERLKLFAAGGKSDLPWSEVAAQAGLTESALKSALHRLRRRYRDLIRDEVAQTVSGPQEVEEELRHLIALVGS